MPKTDVVVEVLFSIKNREKTVIRTNANKEGLKSILSNWLRGQTGSGKDTQKPNEKDEYRIVIGLDLSNDTFYTKSDTGNKSLTCGIVADVFKRLDEIKVESFK